MKMLNKKRRCSLDRDSKAACIRVAIKTGLPISKIEEDVKFIYEIFGLERKKQKYRRFLEMIKDVSAVERLCSAIIERPDSEELKMIAIAFISGKGYKVDWEDKVEEDLDVIFEKLLEGIEIGDGEILEVETTDYCSIELDGNPRESYGQRKKSAYDRLNQEIYGLKEQKQKILQAVKLLKLRMVRQKFGLCPIDFAPIFLFYGPPGTGKTRLAEIMGEIFCEEGLLPGNRMISGSAVTLCKGQFLGHSAPLTRKLFEEHDVIFLDEIYSVAVDDGRGIDVFSQEILAELCVQLENVSKNCNKLVILAGYGGGVMEEHNLVGGWLKSNPGIASRITFFVEFYPYSPEKEMPMIFRTLAKNSDIELEEGWEEVAVQFFKERAKSDDYGNGREARRLLQNCLLIQAGRIDLDNADLKALRLITREDIRRASEEILKGNSGVKKVQKMHLGFL
ncbi:AAA family ATPase [Thermovorax subterraneus]|nr:AAA family ATPase [Thermovorax subterraneus]